MSSRLHGGLGVPGCDGGCVGEEGWEELRASGKQEADLLRRRPQHAPARPVRDRDPDLAAAP
eukprot:2870265-Rhodomonas_salina.2